MTSTKTEPIRIDWTPASADRVDATTMPMFAPRTATSITASEVSSMLAMVDVTDIDDETLPLLAAAASELALVAGIAWRFSTDDPAVALLRIIARATITRPSASGPHTERLAEHLSRRRGR